MLYKMLVVFILLLLLGSADVILQWFSQKLLTLHESLDFLNILSTEFNTHRHNKSII